MAYPRNIVPLRILLVEDSEHDQVAVKRSLEKSDLPFELTVCERAEDIPAVLRKKAPAYDVVILDYNLPGLNGLDAFRRLPHKNRQPPFVMLTGAGSEYLAVEALQAGIYDYIIKDAQMGYLRLLPVKLNEVKQRRDDQVMKQKAKEELEKTYAQLEQMVAERTADLNRTVTALEREISERKKSEHALRESREALRSLSLKIVEAQENERKQVAKDLHDSIGSSLAAIKFSIEDKLRRTRSASDPGLDIAFMEKLIAYIYETITEVRRISTSLRPSMIDDLGLIETIRWYCRTSGELYHDSRIETHLDVTDEEVPGFAKIVIYRVMQEAVNNALKHAEASLIRVVLKKDRHCVRMDVADDGNGFDPARAGQNPVTMSGYGIKSMSDRAEVVGGRLKIDSKHGEGTSVQLEIPFEYDIFARR